jgi:hypothetical protein
LVECPINASGYWREGGKSCLKQRVRSFFFRLSDTIHHRIGSSSIGRSSQAYSYASTVTGFPLAVRAQQVTDARVVQRHVQVQNFFFDFLFQQILD